MDNSFGSVCDDKFKNWEPLDFEYWNAAKRFDKSRDLVETTDRFKNWEPLDFEYWNATKPSNNRRDLDELDVEEELGFSNH